MRVVRWFKCPVVGMGRTTEEKDDSYRPIIANLPLEHFGWGAVYYPDDPPYEFCVVRIEVKQEELKKKEKTLKEKGIKELKERDVKELCDEFPCLKHRWLDQPVHPVVRAEVGGKGSDPVETRYFRSDSHTINTVTAEKLLTTNTTTYKEKSVTDGGTLGGPIAEFITGQLGATKLSAATWTFHFWGRISTIGGGEGYYMAAHSSWVYKVNSSGSATKIAETGWTSPNYGTSFSEEDVSWDCPETNLSTTDAIHVIVQCWKEVYDTNWNMVENTIYFRCGNSTYNSRITNFTYSTAVAYEKILIETLGLLDTVKKDVTLHPLTENLGLVDTVSKGPSKTFAELLGLVDTYGRVWIVQRVYSESLGLVDSVAKDVTLHPLVETLGLLDTILKAPSIVKVELLGLSDVLTKEPGKMLAESLGLVDTYSRTWSAYRTYSEPLGLLDSIQKEPSKTFPEALGLVDSVTKSPSIVKSEALGLVDVYLRTWSVYRTYSELLGLSDSISKGVVLHPLTETLGLLDSLVKSMSITRTELLGLKDFVIKDASVVKSEILGLIDTLTKTPSKTFSETLGLLDTFGRTWAVQRTYTEALGLKDYVSKGVAKTFTELLSLLDTAYAQKNPVVLAKLIGKLVQLEDLGALMDMDELHELKLIMGEFRRIP